MNECTFLPGDYIIVSNENTKGQGCVAKISEVRASDERHVYAVVQWMYWPDGIPEDAFEFDVIHVQSITRKATASDMDGLTDHDSDADPDVVNDLNSDVSDENSPDLSDASEPEAPEPLQDKARKAMGLSYKFITTASGNMRR